MKGIHLLLANYVKVYQNIVLIFYKDKDALFKVAYMK